MDQINPLLLAALIQQFAIPELAAWLKSRKGAPVSEADILAKLGLDADAGIAAGEAWLAQHPD